jgi:two-component system sensor histidine kinase CpxA
MTLRLPLYGRVLAWFGLNLMLLAGLLWMLAGSSLPVESLLNGLAGARVQRMADVLVGELSTRPMTEWNQALARASAVYGVTILMLDEREELIAGPVVILPSEVRERLHPGRGGRGGGRPPGREDRPPRMGGPPEPGMGPGRGPGGMKPPPPELLPPKSILRAGEPPAYWAILHTPVMPADGGRPVLARLILRSDSLVAGGVFFDPGPWWFAGAAVVVLSALWWAPFVGSITRAIRQMTAATEQVAQGHFDVTVRADRGDELGRMGGAINAMAQRLGGMVAGQKRFLGDIAHELCSPLARMEMALGILEQRSEDRTRPYVEDVRDEVRQMSQLVNELLSFSKASLRSRDMPLVGVDVRELLETVNAREADPADAVAVEVESGLFAMGEPDLLARAVGNLLRNALRHAGTSGPIRMRAVSEGGHVVIRVQDEGPGVPVEALPRLTEPFFRPDAARTREQGGTGLGLAIVRSCVEACRGTLVVRNRVPRGFEVEIRLDPGPETPRITT